MFQPSTNALKDAVHEENINGNYELNTIKTGNEKNETAESRKNPEQSSDINPIKWLKTCSCLKDALESLQSLEMRNDMREIEQALLIRFSIDENFDELNSARLHGLAQIFRTKAAVILFMSKDFNSMLIYWKSKEIDYFLNLAPPKKKIVQECKEVYAFTVDFLIESLCRGHLGLQKDCKHSQESNKIELNQLAGADNLNILQISAEMGETKCVKSLLELGIIEDNPHEVLNAPSLALGKQHYDTLLTLMKGNFTYPPFMEIDQCPPKVQQYVKICEELHEAVMSKNIDRVVEIVKQNPNRRHFYNKNNQSVLKIALEKNLYNMYEILLSNDVSFGPHEHFARVFAGLSESDKTILREIHFRCSKDLPENHMNVLMMNTSISHDDTEKEGKEELVLRAYRFLNKNPLLNPILKVVAASKRFDIIFDFKRDSVYAVDPTAPPEMRGSFYVDGRICVGAKQLLDPATEHETFGTLAHELCHYAMNLTFKNRAKPYLKSDQQTKVEYKEIVKFCKEHHDKEEIIKLVFDYEKHLHSAELIVRPAHLLAVYDNQPEKLAELQDIYKGLFIYYIEKVIPAMMSAISSIRKKADVEFREKDKKIFKLTRNFYIAIGLGILIAALVGIYFHKPSYDFDELSIEDQEKVRNAFVSYKNVSVKFKDLFRNDSIAYGKLTSDHITDMLGGKVLDFDDPLLHYLDEIVHFKWDDMAKNIGEKFLKSDLNFQGHAIKFKNLNESSPEAFHALTSQQISKVLNGETLKIGPKVDNDADFYLERKFIIEDARSVYFEFIFGHEYIDKYTIREDHVAARIKMLNKTFQTFSEEFLKQPFEVRRSIIDKIEKNKAMNSGYYDSSHEHVWFMHKHFDEILEQVRKYRIMILSSEAGAGKTTTFKQLSVDIKRNFQFFWVSYVDLKNHTGLYKMNMTTYQLLVNILKLGEENLFELKVFEELYKNGNVVILWNGFDEIFPTYTEFVVNLIDGIHKNTKNIQFVCTRPLFSKQLVDKFRVQSWQLVAFNETDRDNFLREFYAFRNLTEENIIENVTKVKKIIKKLSFHLYMFRVFNTPLMLKLVAETYENQTLLKSGNTYAIYETFVQKKVEIWLERGEFSRKTTGKLLSKSSQFNIIRIFHKYAFFNEINLLNMCTLGLKLNKLQIMQEEIPKYLPYEEISGMGILYINGKDKFEFAHKTFAEFFIAQYFIENVYNAPYDVQEDEAELRLELFFKFSKDFGEKQNLITNFMNAYLDTDRENEKEHFAPVIAQLLRTKYRKFLFRLLDINFPKVFEFLFKFFKRDHDLLVDLLHVHEPETFYTAIFNPNNFALFTDPEEIKYISKKYLSPTKFEKFINGQYQKGVILYGLYIYKQKGASSKINVTKFHSSTYNNLVDSLNCTSFLDFFQELKKNLTKPEQKELFLSAVNPRSYLYYENITNFLTGFNNFKDEYLKLWKELENNLTKSELKSTIGDVLIQYNEVGPAGKNGSEMCLTILLEYTKSLNFTDSEIYNIFVTRNILHDAHDSAFAFESLWNFLVNYTTRDQRRDILRQFDKDDTNFYFYNIIDDAKLEFSNYRYHYYHYDLMPFNIFQKALTIVDGATFNFTIKIYKEHFSRKEIQNIITSSADLPYYVIVFMEEGPCGEFLKYLEKLFEEEEKLLLDYLDTKIKPTSLSALGFVENFRGLSRTPAFWFENLEIFNNLYEKIKIKLIKK